MKLLTDFVYLQLLDILTTLAFLMQGVAEANPFVRWALTQGENPVQSLIMVKVVAIALAIYCVVRARHRVLRLANIFFALVVAYNLVVIIISTPALNG